jgi:hypothetical protein
MIHCQVCEDEMEDMEDPCRVGLVSDRLPQWCHFTYVCQPCEDALVGVFVETVEAIRIRNPRRAV